MRDNATGVSWIHPILTTNISYNDMIVALKPGGKFYGWRYATPDELTRLFVDYTGTPDGIVVGNDALALRFMADLGGPTLVLGGRVAIQDGRLDIDWDLGHAEYAIIRTDIYLGAKIIPTLQGSAVDWYASPLDSHWLVREDLPAPVPEPGCMTLLGAGLPLGVVRRSMRRRRSSTWEHRSETRFTQAS